MPVHEDWLKDPISIINNIFAADPTNFDSKVQEYFDNKLKNEKNYYSIPCLNEVSIHELTPNCLVRFRCMIQDSFDPVYFATSQKLKHKKTGEELSLTLKYKEQLDQMDDEYEHAMAENQNHHHSSLSSRVTYYCIPVPGETDWVKNSFKAKFNNSNFSESLSNQIGSTSNIDPTRPTKRENEEKIQNDDESNEDEDSSKKSKIEELDTKSLEVKTEKTTTKSTNLTATAKYNLNFPLPPNENHIGPSPVACLVKTYDEFDEFKINSIHEFVGILSQDPSLAYTYDEHGADSDKIVTQFKESVSMDTEDHQQKGGEEKVKDNIKKSKVVSSFPPSLVPRLHCIKSFNLMHSNPLFRVFQKETETKTTKEKNSDEKAEQMMESNEKNHNNHNKKEEETSEKFWTTEYRTFLSTLHSSPPSIDSPSLVDNSQVHLIKLRQEIIGVFTEMLLGDALAAEYLLMHLLSQVFMRRDVTVLGKFCLNITNVPITPTTAITSTTGDKDENKNKNKEEEFGPKPLNFVKCFFKAYNKFLTTSYLYELTTEKLNKSTMIPNKDYNQDKLITGMLQLPDNFNFVVDETSLSSGKLDAKGLLNFNSLQDIVKWQKMSYDFSYHQQEFPTSMRVLVLSDTKSLLPADCLVKMKISEEKFDSEKYEQRVNEKINSLGSQLTNNIRKYFTIMSNLDYKLSDQTQKIVEEDIVLIRQNPVKSGLNAKGKLGLEEFHMLLVIARLQTISYGKTELGLNEWNRAKSVEFERLNNRV